MNSVIESEIQKVIEDEGYRDLEGKPVLLDTLCRQEPAWAANVIRTYKTQLKRAIERLTLCRDLINSQTMPEKLEADIKYILEDK